MHKEGQSSREIDPNLAAAIAAAATLAVAGLVAWPTRAPIHAFLEFLSVDYLTPFNFLNAWGTIMTAIAILASVADGAVALIADIKGRGNRVQATRPRSVGVKGVVRNRHFHYWFILYAWSWALILFGIGYLFHSRIL